jgi:hypothetical protein
MKLTVRHIATKNAFYKVVLSLVFLLTFMHGLSWAQPVFIEQSGIIVIDIESGRLNEQWIEGADGGIVYYEGAEVNQNDVGRIQPIAYQIQITQPGIYRFEWYNRINKGTTNTDHNDSWLRFPNNDDVVFFGHRNSQATAIQVADALANRTNVVFPRGSGLEGPNTTPNGSGGNGYFKVYTSTADRWSWNARTSDEQPHDIFVDFKSPGTYLMEIGARSDGHAIDRVLMYHIETYGRNISNRGAYVSAPESPRGTPNQALRAFAGGDKSIALPVTQSVLNGAGYDPGGAIQGFTWSQRSGPTTAQISNPVSPSTRISNLAVGTYVFRLLVTNSQGATAFDDVTVSVLPVTANSRRVESFTLIDAATNQPVPGYEVIQPGAQLPLDELSEQLNIRANIPPGGNIGSVVFILQGTNGAVDQTRTEGVAPYALFGDLEGDYFSWTPARPQAGFSYLLTATPYSLPRGRGVSGLRLSVDFTFVQTAVVINPPPPMVSAGDNITITLPVNEVILRGAADDDSGRITGYRWTQVSGPSEAILTGAHTPTLTAGELVAGTYVFRLTVTDLDGQSSSDEVTVQVNPEPGKIPLQVVSFSLINAATGDVVQGFDTIADQAVLPLGQLPATLAIRANVQGEGISTVMFELEGQQGGTSYTRVETAEPFALFGDVSGQYNPWVPSRPEAGFAYTLTATPFRGFGELAVSGIPLTISFRFETAPDTLPEDPVVEEPEPEEEWELKADVFPNPSTGIVNFDLAAGSDTEVYLLIFNNLGQRIFEITAQGSWENAIDLGRYGRGIYIAHIRAGDTKAVRKLLVH